MSEVNGSELSISFRIDRRGIEHNNRIFIAKNVDGKQVQDNISYCRQYIREKYDELFGQAFAEYNARQTQENRRIPDYYEHLKKSPKGKSYYEIVVQFGDMESCGQESGKWEEAKLIPDDYLNRGLEKQKPTKRALIKSGFSIRGEITDCGSAVKLATTKPTITKPLSAK